MYRDVKFYASQISSDVSAGMYVMTSVSLLNIVKHGNLPDSTTTERETFGKCCVCVMYP